MGAGQVQWPDDKEFEENIRRKKLYGTGVCPYFLRELDRSLGGDVPADKATLEHVLPQNPESSSLWCKEFTEQQRKDLTDTISNLVLLSPEGQNRVKNKDYSLKRGEYKSTSMYKITRDFSDNYSVWRPSELLDRQSKIVKWALSRWSHTP